VSQPSRRWLVQAVLVVAVLGFLGFSIVPIYSAIRDNQPARTSTGTPSPTTGTNQSQLQAQEQGYEAVLEREPDNRTALEGLLRLRLQKIQSGTGEVKDTIEPLQKLITLDPERLDYRLLLAQAQQQTGNLEEAADNLQAILEKQPGNLDALRGLVSVQLQENRPDAAIALLEDTLAASQDQANAVDVPQVQLVLGEVYATQQRYDDAIALYDQMIAADKQDFRPVLGKALALQAEGETAAAQSAFNAAVSLAPAQYKEQVKQLAAQPSPNPAP
jgi:tetratricopeptide (TPR) repeat protein